MKSDTFAELVDSMKKALEHAQGQRSLRTTTLPRPPAPFNGKAVKRVRTRLRASQAVRSLLRDCTPAQLLASQRRGWRIASMAVIGPGRPATTTSRRS